MSTNHTSIATIFEELSYHRVRSTLLFCVGAGVLIYIGLIIMSTVTITHSKQLVVEIRDTQGAITELNGALTIKNQDLAAELKDSAIYQEPIHVSYLEKDQIITPSFALDR